MPISARETGLAGLTDLDGWLKDLQQALSLEPRSTLQTNLGMIQAAEGNSLEAEAAFRQAVAADPKSVSAHFAVRQSLWSAGRPAHAEGAFEAAVALEPGSVLANRALAALYLRLDRAAEAEPYFKKTVEASGTVEAKLALADYYVGLKRPADAMGVLEKLSAEPRYWALARAKLAGIQHAEGKTADAFRTVDEVVAKQPTLAQAPVVRGRLLLADGRIDEALRDGQEAVKMDPGNAEAHYLLGTVFEARRDLDAAAKSFGEVLRLNPRAAPAQVRLAMIQMQRGDLPSAMQLAEQAAAQQPGNLTAQLVLARSLLARGDLDRGTAVTRSLLDAAPQAAGIQNQAGMLALAKGDRAGARTAFEEALALNDRLVEPLTALVALVLEEKKPEQARARVEQRLKKTPNASPVLALAGRTWVATGDARKGEEFLRRAIDADSANLDAYSLLGGLYLSQRKLDQALTEFEKLAVRQPGSVGPPTMAALILQAQGKEDEARPEVNDTLGFVHIKKQLPSMAIPPLRLAVEKVPANPGFHYRLGLAYSQIGDRAAARRELEQALKLKADFEGAEDARKVLRSLG